MDIIQKAPITQFVMAAIKIHNIWKDAERSVKLSVVFLIPGGSERGASLGTSALKINADLSQAAIEVPETLEWRPSPVTGVWRRMLDRDGDEVSQCLYAFP